MLDLFTQERWTDEGAKGREEPNCAGCGVLSPGRGASRSGSSVHTVCLAAVKAVKAESTEAQ